MTQPGVSYWADSTRLPQDQPLQGDDRQVHECSAVCPHLGCVVHWNDAEKTWDCPCHGSRFSKEGKVLHGPAPSDLEPVAEASHAH